MDRRALDRSLAYVDSWLAWRCPREPLPGCVVAVTLRGRVLLSGAYGHADLGTGRRLGANDVFRVASHSKSFTAAALLQLVERGRLGLDDPVADHLGWLADHRDRRWRDVSVRQLLCHGAGIVRDGLDSEFWQLGRPFPDRDQLRAEVLDAELVLEPDVAMKYSNFGYGLAGAVIEEVTGRSYHEQVSESVLAPLGLASITPEPAPGEPGVTGHGRRRPDGSRPTIPAVDTRALAPATGFASDAVDLCRWFTALVPGSRKVLGDPAKREMQRVHWRVERPGPGGDEDYGLGLELIRVGDRKLFGHGGGFPGQITKTLADPAEGLVVTALTNGCDGPASEIARGVLHVIDHFQAGAAGATPARSRSLRRLEGRYVNLWSVADVVAHRGGLSVGTPDSWKPFADAERLEPLDPTTLRITETSSFGSEGETVRFRLGDAEVDTVSWAGMTMWPEARWPAAERRLLGARRRRAPAPGGTGPGSATSVAGEVPECRTRG